MCYLEVVVSDLNILLISATNLIYTRGFLVSMITLDGSYGEGGGQIVRTALALSALTGKAFEVDNIRHGRKQPGLKAQHLHCIKALEKLCNAKHNEVEVGSSYLRFLPGDLKGRNIDVDIGTAGSVGLLLQAVLLPSMFAPNKVKLSVKGGTAGKWAMPYEYAEKIFFPMITRFTDKFESKLIRRGYYPKGGGEILLNVKSRNDVVEKFDLVERGSLMGIKGVSHCSKDLMEAEVAERQAKSAEIMLKKFNVPIDINVEYSDTDCAGSGITVWGVYSKEEDEILRPAILGGDALGEKGRRAEQVGEEAAQNLIKAMDSGAAVDEHLADNLIPFLAIAGGSINVSSITEHTKTNMFVTEQFLDVKFSVEGNVISVNL